MWGSNKYGQTDGLTAAATNAWTEGVDRTNPTLSPTVRYANTVQLLRKDFGVSGTQMATMEIGIDNRFAYEQSIAAKELARDIELALIRGSFATGNASTSRQMDGLWNFLVTNSGDNFTRDTAGTFSETLWNDTFNDIWDDSSELADEVMCSPNVKRAVAGFSANLTRNIDAEDRRLVNTIDVYTGDFGPAKLFMSENMQNGTTTNSYIAYASQLLAKAVLRDETLLFAKSGDHVGGSVLAELTLEVRSPVAAGGRYQLSVAL